MFGDQFYPTPDAIIWKMVGRFHAELQKATVLDPSAGDGAILDTIKSMTNRYGGSLSDLYAIEIDPDLRSILAGKGYKVIDTDFLAYNGLRYFDFIIMNPPFSEGARHLLKAWQIANGAVIVCLLNAATLQNRNTREREELGVIVDRYGEVEQLGNPFAKAADARRPTNVEVVMIILADTRKRESFRLDFEPEMANGSIHLPDFEASELAPADVFDSYEARFNAVVGAFKDLLGARQKVNYYLQGLLPAYHSDVVASAFKDKDAGPDLAYRLFFDDVTKLAWDNLFEKTKLGRITTRGVRDEIEKQQTIQGSMAFTAANMNELFYLLALNKDHIMIECILEVFDELTKYYYENREMVEGWKTNGAYLVGKKFILPYVGSVWGSGIDYRSSQTIADIERALCFLSGKRIENILSITSVYEHKDHYGERMTSEFFTTQLFKKKTMHFWWRDEDLRQQFNQVVAKERWGWLPEKTKRGMYR